MRIPNFVFRRTKPKKPLPNSVYFIEDKSGNREVIYVDRKGRKTYISSSLTTQNNQQQNPEQNRISISSIYEFFGLFGEVLVFSTLTKRDLYSPLIPNNAKVLAIVMDIEGDTDTYYTTAAVYYRGPETNNTWTFVRAINNGDEIFAVH